MSEQRSLSTGLKMAVEFGPLIVFFVVNRYAPGSDVDQAIWATGAFMLATIAAMAVSKLKTGVISPMLWVTGAIVMLFGGLTIWLHDEAFIQLKPTVIYAGFALILFGGLATGRPTLKIVLESSFPALDAEGWRKLTRNWALFFAAMAILNEVMRARLSFDDWVTFKVWAVTALSFIFALSQAPILMKHGDIQDAEDPPLPPQG